MKTLRLLKINSIIQPIYWFCCIAFSSCLIINEYCAINSINNLITAIGTFFALCWLLGYIFIVPSFVLGLIFFLIERKSPDSRKIIGKKHILMFMLPVISGVLFMVALAFVVEFTGGV